MKKTKEIPQFKEEIAKIFDVIFDNSFSTPRLQYYEERKRQKEIEFKVIYERLTFVALKKLANLIKSDDIRVEGASHHTYYEDIEDAIRITCYNVKFSE